MRVWRQQRRRNNGTSSPHLCSSSTVVEQGRIVLLPIIVLIIQSLFLTTPSTSRFFFLLLLSFRTTTTTTRAWTLGSRSSPCYCYGRRRLRPSVLLYQHNRRREQRSSGLLLFSSTSRSSSDDDVNDAQSYSKQDLQRWERMYYEQEEELLQQRSSSVSSSASNKEKSDMVETETTSSTSSSPIRIITLDLDNTLWDTTATIARANDVLAEFMNEQLLPAGNKQLRVEKIMGKLWIRDKSRYAPIEQDQAKAPVLLTKLRKDAIRHVLQQQEGREDDDSQQEKTKKENEEDKEGADDDNCMPAAETDHETLVETAFQIWTQARHEAIPFHLAESALSCLQELRSSSSPLLMGAITDGNSNPMSIPELAPYFDFCINAEMVGVGKPDKRVFLRAVQHVQQHYPEILMSSGEKAEQSSGDSQQLYEEWLEEAVGNWWVHIGDDFVKDIVAAKNLNMRSIWCRELVLDKTKKANESSSNNNDKPNNDNDPSSSPKRTVEELVRKVSEMKVVEMQVGADRYLADSLQNEFADAITDEFRNVADIIQQWQQEAVRDDDSDNNSSASPVNGDTGADALTIDEEQSFFEVIRPDPKTSIVANDDDVVESSAAQAIDSTKKFCIHCGEKLPTVARFCSACGEKQ